MKFPEEFRHHPPGLPLAPSGAPFGAFLLPARHAMGRRLLIIAAGHLLDGIEHHAFPSTQP